MEFDSPQPGRIDLLTWLLRVLTWDTALPLAIALIAIAVDFLFANHRGAVELASILLPVVAFAARLRAGSLQIAANYCSRRFQILQLCVFCAGIAVLALIECVLILSVVMPQGPQPADLSDLLAWAILFCIYLIAMFIAMYPGRTPFSAGEPGSE